MELSHFLAPLFAQVALTLVLLFMLGMGRTAAVRRGEVKLDEIALESHAWPPRLKQLANAFANQFELPVLFYVATLLAIVTGKTDKILLWLSWSFVAFRVLHAFIHVTSNNVPSRFRAYVAGIVALICIWIWLILKILVPGVVA